MKSKGSIRKTLLAVMNDPNATPHDRIAASDRLARLKKAKPRGIPVKKAREAQEAELSKRIATQAAEEESSTQLSPRERLEQIIAEPSDFADQYELTKRARIEALNAVKLSAAESARLSAQQINSCVKMDSLTRARVDEDARLRFLEQLMYERLSDRDKQQFQSFFWYSPAERARAQAGALHSNANEMEERA